ncbi:Predicted anti-anti-sigma factor (Response regulator family protein) [Desulfamplus magnetovallimortis]|uniref:Predicted anti-anti-sigma factor (Response regulator family protein) n=1 Tax=Desulfamplus magnetovallimortis TaxID=1246637 RepID=A0A1W1HG05_9BACT|nr:response regulator [Desulfamplus magnetovallimortis]SLM31353.1 Predicted anti-anti-sigma factor (Response regulator family protein) [Desulfamplus magnetovallimortis]
MKVLVIDDEKPTLSMFKLFLTAYGYQVFVAQSGEEGVAVYEKERPQIVFTDLKMPGIDGIEVLKRIHLLCKAHAKSVQVIIITGHGDMDKAIEALDLDASDFISKPVAKKALDASLKRAELRIKQSSERKNFDEISFQRTDTKLRVKISGKLTSNSETTEKLGKYRNKSMLEGIESLCIIFDQNFSIKKDGISWLMAFISEIRDVGIEITMEGLSYNYIRFFQMAGLHEIATIIESNTEE